MGIFLRAEWQTDNNASLCARKLKTTRLLTNPYLQNVVGKQWYELGMSLREALSRPVNMLDQTIQKPWEATRIDGDTHLHRLNLWNGTDDERGAELYISLRDLPSIVPDTFVISLTPPRLLRTTQIEWDALLRLGRILAKELGGLTVLSSGDLVAIGEDRNLACSDSAVYAAFWGFESTQDANHMLKLDLPHEIIVARTWDEVFNPDSERLCAAVELLSHNG